MSVDTRELLSEAKFFESYSRWSDKKGRYETWDESVDRVMDMHREFYKDKMSPELEKAIAFATKAYKEKKVLGSQRSLQFAGPQLLKNHAKSYNCAFSYADRPAFFGECFHLLLSGAGTGFSVQFHHVAKLPSVVSRNRNPKIHVVEDSIEGWAEAVDVLLSSFFETGGKHPEYRGCRVYFDLSKIRPKGAHISGGFVAPGPDGLRLSLDRIEHLLQGLVLNTKRTRLRPIHVYDIVMHISDAVLSGGLRRSAAICIFSPEDEEMADAKTGNWYYENPQRARSNNSALLVRDKVTREQFADLMSKVKQFGEPGFIFSESTEHGFNPCMTGDTRLLTKKGYIRIREIVSNKVEVWNGKQWSEVTPFSTGVNPIMEVKFSDGTTLKCTPYHKFILKGGRRVEAKDLKPEDQLEKFDMPVLTGGVEYSDIDAYSQGFYAGDGCTNLNWSWVYDTKFSVIDHLKGSVAEPVPSCPNRRTWRHGPMKDKTWVPHDAYLDFRLRWLCGLFDADGYVTKDKNMHLTSNDKDFLMEVRLMLTTMGVQAKVIDLRPAQKTRFKLDQKEYDCKATYRLLINAADLRTLIELGATFYRLKVGAVKPNRDARRFTEVISVRDLGYNEETFCATEPFSNSLTFEGIVTGNCVEIGLYPVDITSGQTGWELCNLSDINGSMCNTEEEFLEACEAASVLGTLQAGYTDFKFLSDATKRICDREALLGVSINGWMSNPHVLFDERIMKKGAEKVKEVNRAVAKLLGINPAARATTTKPSGNSGVILKTPSGIHPDHSPRYFRNVQMNKLAEVAKLIQATNPHMVEDSVWSASHTDYVISFPVIAKPGSLFKNDMKGVAHLEYVKKAQMHWIEHGTSPELCVEPKIRHNISNTIMVDDWDAVEQYLFDNRNYFAGVSLIPETGDKIYNQAPNTEVLTHLEIVEKYGTGSLFASGLIVDGLKVFDNLWHACDFVRDQTRDTLVSTESTMRDDWARRFISFAHNYFEGDRLKTEYCLKDVYLLHKWEKIQNHLVELDFATQLQEKRFVAVDTLGAAACAGVTENGESACLL